MSVFVCVCLCVCVCVYVCVCFRASVSIGLCLGCLGLWARESSVKDTIRQGVKGRGGEERRGWWGEKGRMCWRGKKETRLRKSEKSVGEVFKPLKQNAQKCTVSKFLFQIRKCIKAQHEDWWYHSADRKGPHAHFMSSHRETCYNRANIVHLQLVCMLVRARQTERAREKESRWGEFTGCILCTVCQQAD